MLRIKKLVFIEEISEEFVRGFIMGPFFNNKVFFDGFEEMLYILNMYVKKAKKNRKHECVVDNIVKKEYNEFLGFNKKNIFNSNIIGLGKECFMVDILYCKNATWQGTVTKVAGEEKICFRSGMELICLISKVMEKIRINDKIQ